MSWMHRLEARRAGAILINECEAFLTGRLAELWEQVGPSVPQWAWINLLAHGSADDLRSEMFEVPSGATCWSKARAFLAGEVLDAAAACGGLEDLQRSLLVPMELSLAGSSEVTRWDSRELVTAIEDALGAHRRSCQREKHNS